MNNILASIYFVMYFKVVNNKKKATEESCVIS